MSDHKALYKRVSCVGCGAEFDGLRSRNIQDCLKCLSKDCFRLKKMRPDVWKQAWAALERIQATEPDYYNYGLDYVRDEFCRLMADEESEAA